MARRSTSHEPKRAVGNGKEIEARQGPIEIFLREVQVDGSSPKRT
jgi:hypothetical protein